MENLLLKLARQLDALDEASLMGLWSKYATQTSRFEPTKRWEEACLVFSMIQAKRWKNQLFNYNWSHQRLPPLKDVEGNESLPPNFEIDLEEKQEPCRIIEFRPRKKDGRKEE